MRTAIPKKLRFEILKRDDFKCRYCGRGEGDGAKLQVDHVIPVALEGRNDPENLVTSCADCNLGKAANLLADPKLIGVDFDQRRKVLEAAQASLDRYRKYLREKAKFEQRLGRMLVEPVLNYIALDPFEYDAFRLRDDQLVVVMKYHALLGADEVRASAATTAGAILRNRIEYESWFAYFIGVCKNKSESRQCQ